MPKSLIIVYLGLLLTNTLAIRNGDPTLVLRPHNKPTVFIHVDYEEDIILGTGSLVHRSYILTSALSIPENATTVFVRAASIQSYEGGIIRYVSNKPKDRQYIGLADPDYRLRFCLARLTVPLELSYGHYGFLISYLYRPRAYHSDHSERFVITGWNTRRTFPMQHEMPDMNAMLVKESNMFACAQDYEFLEKFMYDDEDIVGCYCPITCEFVCSTGQFPVWIDNGAGIFVKDTNLLFGVVQSKLTRKNMQVNALISRTDRILFSLLMALVDDYEEFKEFDGML